MKKFATALLIAAVTAIGAQAQIVSSSIVNGKVAVNVDGTVAMSGLNLKSEGGYFVPIPPGDTTAPAAPFTFLLANNASNVFYAAMPGSTVDVSGQLVTDVGYNGAPRFAGSDMFRSSFGNAAFQDVNFVLPEPSSGVLGAMACVGLLGFRRRRSN